MINFEEELCKLLNQCCQESESHTPDFILAKYLQGCLKTYNEATLAREQWYGRDPNTFWSDK